MAHFKLKASGNVWGRLNAFGSVWDCLEAPGTDCKGLKASGSIGGHTPHLSSPSRSTHVPHIRKVAGQQADSRCQTIGPAKCDAELESAGLNTRTHVCTYQPHSNTQVRQIARNVYCTTPLATERARCGYTSQYASKI